MATNPAAVGEVVVSDPSIHELVVRPWELCHTPMEAGAFGYRMRFLRLDGVTLYRETFDLRCRLRGLSPPDTLAFSLPLRLGTRSNYWGAPLDSPGLPAMLPGGLDMSIDRGQVQWVVLLERRVLPAHYSPSVAEALEQAARSRLLPAYPGRLESFGAWLSRLLDTAHATPGLIEQSAAARSMRDHLLDHLARTLALDLQPELRAPASTRNAALDRALELLRYSDPVEFSVPELCRAAGASQRTLEYAFRETFDLSPLGFIRMRRLHAARAALMLADPRRNTVAEVASSHGFCELGRFAAAYRRMFAELPSSTLGRRRDDSVIRGLAGSISRSPSAP